MTYPTLSWNVPIRILCKWGSESSMEIGQYAVQSVNLTLGLWSLQCFCSDLDLTNKQNIADVQFDKDAWVWWLENMKNSHLTSLCPLQLITQWRPQSAKIIWLMLGQCWRHVSAVNTAVVKPTVLAEQLVEKQKDSFEMWGILSSWASHFLNRHEDVANVVVFVKWCSGWFLDTMLGKLVNIGKDSLIMIFFLAYGSWVGEIII